MSDAHDPRRDKEELEISWRQNVRAAYAEYQQARNTVAGTARYAADIGGPDGALAHRQALRRELTALHRYRTALRIFTDLVVHGKTPPCGDS